MVQNQYKYIHGVLLSKQKLKSLEFIKKVMMFLLNQKTSAIAQAYVTFCKPCMVKCTMKQKKRIP